MAKREIPDTPADSVEAVVNYLRDTGVKPVTHTAEFGATPVERTGAFEPRTVTVHDARPAADRLSLDREGFVFVRHDTRVADFYDEEQLRSVYYPETDALVKRLTGASRVIIFDHTLRAQDDGLRAEKKVREPNRSVHNDYTECRRRSGSGTSCRKTRRRRCSGAGSPSSRCGGRSGTRCGPTPSPSPTRAPWIRGTWFRPSAAIPIVWARRTGSPTTPPTAGSTSRP